MKTVRLKSLVLGAAVLLAPAPVLAQTAAGSVPNSFDGPAAQAAPSPAPRSQGPASTPAASPADVEKAETALRGVITAIQGPGLDYSVFTDNLASQIRQQSAQVTPLIKSFGALQAVEHQRPEGQAQLFRVTFENQATDWLIGFDDAGKIAALLFRPAES